MFWWPFDLRNISATNCRHLVLYIQVINEPDLVNELELLSKSTNQAAKKAAEGALWKASREDKRQQQTKQQTSNTSI